MKGFQLNPNTRRKWLRFRSIRRGYFSFLTLLALTGLALLGPLLVGNRALIVRHGGHWYFPVFSKALPGDTFGLGHRHETDYRILKGRLKTEAMEAGKTGKPIPGNWLLLPPIPYNGTEVCEVRAPLELRDGRYFLNGEAYAEGKAFIFGADGRPRREWGVIDGRLHGMFAGYDEHGEITERGRWENGRAARYARATADGTFKAEPLPAELAGNGGNPAATLSCLLPCPTPPGVGGHLLGTDESGHDVLARLFHGFRILCAASAIYLALTCLIGVSLGCMMGYRGGWFDIICQRAIEIWSNVPHLYLIIFLTSLLIPNLLWLMLILVAFSWITLAGYMRTATYREKERDYVAAARLLGASEARIIFRHILPNTLSILVTFLPFMVAAVVFQLTALDFLGFGLPPTEPTWGEMLRQGTENFDSPWIFASVATCLVVLLTLVTFVGEAIREAFDPKKFTTYQ
ncbi:MAG: ABC transporter permease subunit [Puniceicoccales bacterium]|nr:ABC transporter permease subunit [Puniceicoccales bacterium]